MSQLEILSDFDFLSAEYEELFKQSDVTAFQHPAWHAAMHKHVQSLPNFTSKTVLIRCPESTKLLAVLPLVVRKVLRTTILEYANLGLVDYAMPTFHRQFWQLIPDVDLLGKMLGQTLGSYDLLRIKHMPTNDPDLLRLFPNSYVEQADFSAHATELTNDYDTWRLQAVSKSERRHRDKKRRAMVRAGEWQMRRLTQRDEIRQAFSHMRMFHLSRYKGRAGQDMLQNPSAYNFYVDLACEQAESGFARLYQFTHNGEIAAVQFGLCHAKRYLYLMMGADYERLSKYSPGLLMAEDIIRDCIEDGMKVVDLTIGDEAYKLKFGTQPVPIYTLWHTNSMLGAMGRTAKDIVVKHQLKEHFRRWVS